MQVTRFKSVWSGEKIDCSWRLNDRKMFCCFLNAFPKSSSLVQGLYLSTDNKSRIVKANKYKQKCLKPSSQMQHKDVSWSTVQFSWLNVNNSHSSLPNLLPATRNKGRRTFSFLPQTQRPRMWLASMRFQQKRPGCRSVTSVGYW